MHNGNYSITSGNVSTVTQNRYPARLTAKQAEHVKPSQKRAEIPAGPPTGLYLVVHPTGAKTWAFRYRWLGKPAKLTFKKYPDMSLAQARAEAEAARSKLERGINPAADYAEEQDRLKPNAASEVISEWLQRKVLQTRTAYEVERVVTREILPICKHKLIGEIGRADILRMLDSIVDRGAPIAANATLSILKRFFNWAVERGYVEASPAAPISPPAPRKSRDRVLTDSELAQVYGAAVNLGYPYGPFVQMLILSAQRRGEVAGMRWEDLNTTKKLWTLPAEQTKPGRIHDVPLSAPMLDLLKAMPRFAGPFVFSYLSGKKPINSFSRCKSDLDATIALAGWTTHDFRRTAASWMAQSGIPPHVLSALLNHSPGTVMGVTAIYNRFRYLEERREALEAWAQHVLKISRRRARKAS